MVCRDSSALWASAVADNGKDWPMEARTTPEEIIVKRRLEAAVSSSLLAVYVISVERVR